METRTMRQDVISRAMGNTVKILRKRSGIAQERLAMLAGIDRSHMSSIERGVHTPNIFTLTKMLPFLDCTFEEFGKVLDAELDRLWGNPTPPKKPREEQGLVLMIGLAAEVLNQIRLGLHHLLLGMQAMMDRYTQIAAAAPG